VNRDLVFGAACLAVAAGYYLMASAIPESALSDTVGPQGLPQTYAIVLGALSLVLIARSARQSPAESRPRSLVRVGGMLLIGVLYLAVVPWLGYVLSLTGLIAATTYYQGGGLSPRVALVSLSGAVFFWVLFVAVLGIPHPPGIWPSLF
jgi:putative tricarboxylic transport membrane protein